MLFYHKNGNFNQIQKNKKYVREIIESAIEESIRKMMPFDHILEEYLKNALDDNAEYTSSESEDSEPDDEGDLLNNDKVIHSFKTKIGSEDLDNILLIFFDHLKKIIINKFPNYNLKSVITVPSNFNDIQREIIKKNFISIGFDVIRIINEPSAAALSYGLSSTCQDEEKILVIDLGGGTLDITLLLKDNGFFEVLHSIGLNDLGGNDFTKAIYDFLLKQYPDFNNDKLTQLWYTCQNAKEKLSWVDNYEIKINNYNNKNDLLFNLNINKFHNLCNNLIYKLENILNDIYDKFNDIKYIIMVGNSSKMPIIKSTIEKIFNKEPWLHPNLESVVSEGACLYGAILENIYKTDNNVVLVDVLPLSLGIETVDGNFSVIIPKDTPIPIKRTQKYTTDTPGDNSVIIKVYQGERIIANKNILIGQFVFDKITTGGTPEINITFKVDSNSIITVTVTDKKSGIE
jgi:molecular chaperone DnaK (HSP70)